MNMKVLFTIYIYAVTNKIMFSSAFKLSSNQAVGFNQKQGEIKYIYIDKLPSI